MKKSLVLVRYTFCFDLLVFSKEIFYNVSVWLQDHRAEFCFNVDYEYLLESGLFMVRFTYEDLSDQFIQEFDSVLKDLDK